MRPNQPFVQIWRKTCFVLGFVLGCGVVGTGCIAMAQSPDDPRTKLSETYAQEKSLLESLSQIENSLQTLQSELKELVEQKESIAIEQLKQQQKVKNIGDQFSAIEQRLIEKANLLYKIHRRGLARIIFGAESPIDLRRRSVYLQILIESDKEQLNQLRQLVKERKSVLDSLKRNQNQLDMLEENLLTKTTSLKNERKHKEEFLSTVQQEKALALQFLRERQAAEKRFTQSLPSTPKQPQTLQQVRGTQTQSTPQKPASFADMYGSLQWPLNGTVLRRFGKQKDPISGQSIQSNGIDIQAPRGSRVLAVYDGVVALAKFIDTYGQTVVINHGRYSTVYAHLSGLNVQQGQRIKAGTAVGMVGNSGITDAQNTNWLSFEIRYNKTPQDPLRWLKP